MATDYEAMYYPVAACDRIDRLRETVEHLRTVVAKAEQERKELRTACAVAADLLKIIGPASSLPEQSKRIAAQCLTAARLDK
jgi:hypothetical protein